VSQKAHPRQMTGLFCIDMVGPAELIRA
jgi:hypothetical protein